MKVFGLTGGVGMGKSTSAQFLRERAVPVVDTDDLARQTVEPGEPALGEIRRAFGDDIIGPDGRLRRDTLAERVFSDPPALKQLEDILHPRIRELWTVQIASWKAQSLPLAVVVIPLLFETQAQAAMDASICVACSVATQRRRLLSRGWSARQIEQRISAQWPVERKIAMANYVVWTEGSLEVQGEQLQRILPRLLPTRQ
jgi:dephospho-CoA kinase